MMTHRAFIISEVEQDYGVIPPYQGGISTKEGYEEFRQMIKKTIEINDRNEEKVQSFISGLVNGLIKRG